MEMTPSVFIAKFLIGMMSRAVRKDFRQAQRDPVAAQQKVLQQILKLSGIDRLPSEPTDFTDYPKMKSWTREPVLFFEMTSGSSGIKKPIPYTKSLRTSFQNLFLLWIDDLLTTIPFGTGRFYMSVSPQLESLGMTSDLEYLNPFLQKLLNRFLITRPSDLQARNGRQFQRQMALRLLQAEDLEGISVWSPTAFLATLDVMVSEASFFESRVAADRLTLAKNQDWEALWPNLKLISCWGDGSSTGSYQQLRQKFPSVRFQKKGLLATEAPMTIPLMAARDAVPLWTEVYFEYLENGLILPLTEIAQGQEVELLISTKGGCLRYRLGDRVRCTFKETSNLCLEFLGRGQGSVDLVGEKFSEDQVYQILRTLKTSGWMLVPRQDGYVFVSDTPVSSESVEQALRASHHYALARELGQLRAVQVDTDANLMNAYFDFCQQRGQRRGDIKDRYLLPNSEFLDFLRWRKESRPSALLSVAPSSNSL